MRDEGQTVVGGKLIYGDFFLTINGGIITQGRCIITVCERMRERSTKVGDKKQQAGIRG